MLAAALAHRYFFSSSDFWTPSTGTITPLAKMQRAEAEFSRARALTEGSAAGAGLAPAGVRSFVGAGGGGGGGSRDSARIEASGGGRGLQAGGSEGSGRSGGGTGAYPEDAPVIVQIARGGGGGRGGVAVATAARGGIAMEVADKSRSSAFSASAQLQAAGGSLSAQLAAAAATPAAAASPRASPRMPSASQRELSAGAQAPEASAGAPSEPRSEATITEEDVMSPAPFMAVVKEMLPFDVLQDTSDQLRSGFGVLHKWEKRRKEAEVRRGKGAGRRGLVCLGQGCEEGAPTPPSLPGPPTHAPAATPRHTQEEAAKMEKWARDGTMRTKPKSRHIGEGPGGAEGDGRTDTPSPSLGTPARQGSGGGAGFELDGEEA